jgi:hypothetical protein
VLLLDVLEHLYDPWRALTRIRTVARAGTRRAGERPQHPATSRPRRARWGGFQYAENGVLDVTHVRFFTKRELQRMFEETGYRVNNLEPLTQPETVDALVVNRRPGRLDTRNVSIGFRNIDDLEDLYAFQYVVEPFPRSDT